MAFFPNFLKWRYKLEKQAQMRIPFHEDYIPPSIEILSIWKERGPIWEIHFFLNEYDLNTDKINDNLYKIVTNKEVRTTLQWISNKILSTIGRDNYMSVEVYTRIGTSMINKLVEKGEITKEQGIHYHDNFIRNMADLLSTILEEDLPF